MRSVLSVLGPGIFAIGYTIGTGSVTSMTKAGADSGLGLLWVLALSCLFSGVLMEAYGRMAAVTGETSLRAIRTHLPCGKLFAWLVFAGVVMGQYTCLGGILTLSSGAIAEMLGGRVPPFAIAAVLSVAMYALLMIGRYSAFEKILAFFVGVMALTFLVSVFVVAPDAATASAAGSSMHLRRRSVRRRRLTSRLRRVRSSIRSSTTSTTFPLPRSRPWRTATARGGCNGKAVNFASKAE